MIPRKNLRNKALWIAAIAGLAFTALGLAAEPAPPARPAELPRGTLVAKVPCAGQPDQAYALYLPSTYTPERRWPILYAFDARAEGKRVSELFQSAAETYGWILVSSWNTASDGPMEPNFTAMHALWADTHTRFAIDDSRVYAAGYSGTVRFACILALTAPGTIAGVIAAGAGFPFGSPPKKDNPFVYFGTVGDRDFNYYEMNDLDERMKGLGLPHRVEHFAGPHDWPPAELATQAVGWMELQAMKSGKREKSAAIIEAEWARDKTRARAASHPADALHIWSAMAVDYAGLRDVAEAEREAATLAASPACKQELAERAKRDRRDKEILARAPGVMARANPDSEERVTAAQIAADLKIPELQKRAASDDPEERLSATRILNTYLGQMFFYLPQSYLEKKEYDRAIFALSVGAEMRPDDPDVWVEIASVYARKGKAGRKKALESLRTAVDKGLSDPASLDHKAFADFRQDEEFQRLLNQVTERHRGTGNPPAEKPSQP